MIRFNPSSTAIRFVATAFASAAAVLGLQAQPLITSVVETGGDNEATDTIQAKWTGVTWNTTIANEPILNTPVGTPYTAKVFGPGVPVYVDRAHAWSGITAEMAIPDYLLGGEYILSGNDNRDNASYKLDITITDTAYVYMLIDNRVVDNVNADPPNFSEGVDPNGWTAKFTWLGTNGFMPVLSGWNRSQDPSIPDEVGIDEGADGTINNWFSVYSALVQPGTFTIYEQNNASINMYGVVIKRMPNSINNPPEVKNLTPANNTLFYAAASGISFTATTVSPNTIPTSNIKLFLNSVDVSAGLTVTGTGANRSASYAALQPDTLYAARLEVSDQAGRTTTTTFNFDTFNAATTTAIEAEDYNYEGGKTQAAPTPGSYASLLGTREIDFHNNNATAAATVYRIGDFVGQAVSGDVGRKSFTDLGVTDHQITTLMAGDWWNYTRTMTDGGYRLYLRASSGTAQLVRLDRVTSDVTASNQTVSPLGTFKVEPGSSPFSYAPLVDAQGNPLVVRLSGTTTLRMTALAASANLQLNYLLLVPTTAPLSQPYIASAFPAAGAANVAPDAVVQVKLADGGATVDPSNIALKFNGVDVTSSLVKTPGADGILITYDFPGLMSMGATQAVELVFGAPGAPPTTNLWSFTTVASITKIPVNFGTPLGSGQGSGINFKIRKAPNLDVNGAALTLENTAARANSQLADQLIDPLTLLPYENEALGPNSDGVGTAGIVNFEQAGLNAGFFAGDAAFPYIDLGNTPDPNNIAMEFTAYVELPVGIHRFAIRSDDGFRLTTGPTFSPADATLLLGEFEGGRGDALPGGETAFEFQVETAGLYSMRLIAYEGNGGANVEWYWIDRQTQVRRLINDGSAGGIKAFTSRTTQVYVPTVAITSPTNATLFPTGPTNVEVTASASVMGGTIAKVEFFSGTSNKVGEATAAPYKVTLNNLSAGPYTLWARATDNKGTTKDSDKITFKIGLVVQVNFQNISVMEAPVGYLPDYGYAYTDDYYFSTYNYHYGWDLDNTANARDRNNALSPDERYDTFNHMQKPQPAGSLWEIELPNGRYNVFAVAGEAANFDSVFDIAVEGVSIVKGTATSATRWFEGIGAVQVADGRLSIGNGPTASNNKICFVEIYQLPAEVPRPVLNPPTLSGGTLTITWTGGRLQESSNAAGPYTDVPGNPQGTYSVSVSAAPQKFYRVAQ